jgi:hypothetical protein
MAASSAAVSLVWATTAPSNSHADVVRPGVLVVGVDDIAPAAVPERAATSYCSRFSGPKRYQEKPP